MKGCFITFEGIEACGKTTQVNMLYDYLIRNGRLAIKTREPGGTSVGLEIRNILLYTKNEYIPPIAELLLYEADRNIHLNNIIKPYLEKGYYVISDRYTDSTLAYQHYGRGLDIDLVINLNTLATEKIKPDITFLLDIPVEVSLQRLKDKDRIESENIDFHNRVRKGFLEIAEKNKDRVIIIDGSLDVETIHKKILQLLEEKRII